MTIQDTSKIVIWVFTSLSLLLVLTRLLWRRNSHNLGWDDAAISISVIIVLCSSAFLTASLDTTLNPIHASVLSLVGSTFGVLSLATPKLAVALLLIRVLGTIRRSHKIALLSLAITVNLMAIANAILIWFRCTPVQAVYNPSSYSPSACSRADAFTDFSVFYGCYSALCDLIYAVYPAFLFYSLQMPTRRKVILTVMMGLGVAGAVVGFYKVQFLLDLQSDNTGGLKANLWTSVEANVIHIAACIPTISLLLTFIADQTRAMFSHFVSNVTGQQSSTTTAPRTMQQIEDTDGELKQISRHERRPPSIEDGLGLDTDDDIEELRAIKTAHSRTHDRDHDSLSGSSS